MKFRRVRLNPQPPSDAAYFDPGMLVCSPCQSGAVNYCQTVTPPTTTIPEEGAFEWLFESSRGPVAANTTANNISACCSTEMDAGSGVYTTTCDTAQGCGWVSGQFLTDDMSCRFTTENAQFPTYQACQNSLVNGEGEAIVNGTDWFLPCGSDTYENCYYPNVDACLPAVFGKQRRPTTTTTAPSAAAPSCSVYVCDGKASQHHDGRVSFSNTSCRCIQK